MTVACITDLATALYPNRRHTARFLVIWLALLPFSIFASCGWVTVFSSVVLGFFLLSIEEIGVTIEEPFNILVSPRKLCTCKSRFFSVSLH